MKGLKLTRVGMCCNPECRAPLYAELMIFPDDEACFDCLPQREGLPTAFRMIAEANGFDVQGKTSGEVIEALGFTSPGHCSEDCCRGGDSL